MKKGLVSVVVPIYNVEKYLERCVKSVINQTYTNLEIILVDDGSPDNCPELCEKWAKKDLRIKVVHKKNAGLGMARNTGIENATGEYICFFDSDDYVSQDTVERAYSMVIKHNADLVLYGFCEVAVDGSIKKAVIPQTSKEFYQGEEIQSYILPSLIAPNPKTGERTNLWMSACGCFYSMELIRRTGWRFTSERQVISEDVYSLLRLYKDVTRVAVLSEGLYYYCENGSSLTHTFRPDRYEKIKSFYDACVAVCYKNGYKAEVRERLIYPYISFTIAALKMIVNSGKTVAGQKIEFKRILSDPHMVKALSGVDISKEPIMRKVLLGLMKLKLYNCCYLAVSVKEKNR